MSENISVEFLERLTAIQTWAKRGHIDRHSKLALILEDLAGDIWLKAQELGEVTWVEAEGFKAVGVTKEQL